MTGHAGLHVLHRLLSQTVCRYRESSYMLMKLNPIDSISKSCVILQGAFQFCVTHSYIRFESEAYFSSRPTYRKLYVFFFISSILLFLCNVRMDGQQLIVKISTVGTSLNPNPDHNTNNNPLLQHYLKLTLTLNLS